MKKNFNYFFKQINACLFALMPLPVLFVLFFLWKYSIKKREKSQFKNITFRAKLENERVMRICVFIIVNILVLYVPSGLTRLFYSHLSDSKYGQILIRVADLLMFTFQASGFIRAYATNIPFRKEFHKIKLKFSYNSNDSRDSQTIESANLNSL